MPSLAGFYQHNVPGGTGTISFPVLLPIYRPWRGSTNMPSLAGGYQHAVLGGTGTISFPVLLPIYRPWRDWNIPAFGLLPLLRLLWANWNAKNLDTSAWG